MPKNDRVYGTVNLCQKLISAPRLVLGRSPGPRSTPANQRFLAFENRCSVSFRIYRLMTTASEDIVP
jgi:hypothetical protein